MGAGIMQSNFIIREFSINNFISYQNMLPKYLETKLTNNEIKLCLKHWELIILDLISGYQNNEHIKIYYDSTKLWLHSLIYHNLMINSTLFATKHPDIRHNFIITLRAILVISLKQTKDSNESIDNEIKLLCLRIINLGYDYEIFLLYGEALFNSLQIISGREWSIQLENAWKSLFSSIIFICLTCFPIKELKLNHLSTCEDHSAILSTSTRLTVGLQAEKSIINENRMYTSQYNSVLF